VQQRTAVECSAVVVVVVQCWAAEMVEITSRAAADVVTGHSLNTSRVRRSVTSSPFSGVRPATPTPTKTLKQVNGSPQSTTPPISAIG
jgi:hypothetical protein